MATGHWELTSVIDMNWTKVLPSIGHHGDARIWSILDHVSDIPRLSPLCQNLTSVSDISWIMVLMTSGRCQDVSFNLTKIVHFVMFKGIRCVGCMAAHPKHEATKACTYANSWCSNHPCGIYLWYTTCLGGRTIYQGWRLWRITVIKPQLSLRWWSVLAPLVVRRWGVQLEFKQVHSGYFNM